MDCRLSKSKYCRGFQCPKMLWMDNYKKEEAGETSNQQVLDNGTAVGEFARNLFGEFLNIDRPDDINANSIMVVKTQEALSKNAPVITEASFLYDNNFCSVDILKNFGNYFEIYEVKSSSEVKDIYLEDISYQYYVLTKSGYKVAKACIVYVNNKYIRHGNIEINKLFNIEDVTDIAISKQKEISTIIKHLKEVVENKNEPNIKLGKQCFKPYPCQYWDYCTKTLPHPNVFDLKTIKIDKKEELYNKGLVSYEDLQYEKLPIKTLQQINHELHNQSAEINVENIREFMKKITYPLYFLDFESYQPAIPDYDGVWPYEQVPFQYSLHYIESENSELKHKEFLAEAGTDPRRKIAEKLIKDIPMNVCVTAYHMSFENDRLTELANLFPDLSEHLLNIKSNMVDFEEPFRKRDYYLKGMVGRSSIKVVLPSLFPDDPSLNYHNLDDVQNGTQATAAFLKLKELSKDEQAKLRKNMLKYCGLDTYAMVKVWEKLKEVIK